MSRGRSLFLRVGAVLPGVLLALAILELGPSALWADSGDSHPNAYAHGLLGEALAATIAALPSSCGQTPVAPRDLPRHQP